MSLEKRLAVFLDRDGVINEDYGHITKPEQLKLYPRVIEAISMLNKDYLVFIITNQSVVGRGMCTEEDVHNLHRHLRTLLGEAKIDGIYSCFHHPTEAVGKYKKDCTCRKPRPGMILEAANRYDIDYTKSYFIGDKTTDIFAGFLCGVKTIMVKTGAAGKDNQHKIKPNHIAEDLYDAAKFIMEKK